MSAPSRAFLAAACSAALLSACTQTASVPAAPPPGVIPGVTPNTFSMPSGAGCSGEIARFRAVLRNDVDTGNVSQSVYDRAEPDLQRASGACAAGRDGEANAIVTSTKSRFGYR